MLRCSPPDRTTDIFRALADPSRRRILQLLAKEEIPLNRIAERFDMTRPAVIKHINVLKACRLVAVRRLGRQQIHRLNPLPLRAVGDWVAQFEALWETSLQRLKQQVESTP